MQLQEHNSARITYLSIVMVNLNVYMPAIYLLIWLTDIWYSLCRIIWMHTILLRLLHKTSSTDNLLFHTIKSAVHSRFQIHGTNTTVIKCRHCLESLTVDTLPFEIQMSCRDFKLWICGFLVNIFSMGMSMAPRPSARKYASGSWHFPGMASKVVAPVSYTHLTLPTNREV